MRTAVILLVLLAVAAVPGSLLPQRGVASNPVAVDRFYLEHPVVAPWLDRLWFFEVYSAPWFAAIYVLLLVSMTGCVIPRCAKLWREFRSPPPRAPRHLQRESDFHRITVPGGAPFDPAAPAAREASLTAALDRTERHLRRRGFAVVRTPTEVRAEKGRVRELGNLVFHLSLLVLLVGVAGGRLFGYEARVAVVVGGSFTNVVSSYDAFTPAPWMDPQDLEPLSFTLDSFEAEFEAAGGRAGEPRDFDARVTYTTADDGGAAAVRPNQPLVVNGTKFFLTGHGYAPELTVRDSTGTVVSSGPTIFLPSDSYFTSDGVVKVPDAQPEGLALEGTFYPTAAPTEDGLVSLFPDQLNPRVELNAWSGDLGLDDGATQSVFAIDKTRLREVSEADGTAWAATLAPGEQVALPGGAGTVTFEGVTRFANFQVARDPGKEISLLAAILLMVGLTVSLAVPRRRIWARVSTHGAPEIEIAGRALARRALPPDEIARVAAAAQASSPAHSDASNPHRQETP